ncbi:TolC family protein [Christiangramia echinicola]|uniref:Outer membrane protein TolC n=1 Tax=Christiangramia echinicola TaxID=279359 RepID=A0A1H1RN86_9FLAO|nr:TolC family protein [Christiangramia echinicola]SDS37102.1 Outer membrane protein TolC [Christiangramia echinicola]
MKQIFIILAFILSSYSGSSQTADSIPLGFTEYLAMVKKYHPLVKQADLLLDEGEIKLLKARGSFDPKIEADYSAKNYTGTEYYNNFNSAFKIPTWYGLELNAKYEDNSGVYLNPQNTVPDDGLYSAGISLNVGEGLFMSERMASLKQAKIYRDQSQLKRQLQVTEVLYNASIAYFEWYTAYQQYYLFESFLDNAEIRFQGVSSEYEVGEKPAIDTLEAGLSIQSRKLDLQQSKLELINARLDLSNFLWMEGNVPLELTPEVVPVEEIQEELTKTLNIDELLFSIDLEDHPKLRSLSFEVDILEVEKRLRANKLLPKLDLEYNFLTNNAEDLNTINNRNYKMGVKFSFPLFLRKERGELQLSKLALENAELDLLNARLKLKNDLKSLQNQIIALKEQNSLMNQLVRDYTSMVSAEERKFELGESSLFLINSRENKLISARLKEIEMNFKLLKSKAELFKTLAEVVKF